MSHTMKIIDLKAELRNKRRYEARKSAVIKDMNRDLFTAKKNELIDSSYDMSLWEHRVLNHAMKAFAVRENLDKMEAKVGYNTLFEKCDLKGDSYAVVHKAVESLKNRTVRLKDSDKEIKWFTKIKITYSTITFTFNKELHKYIEDFNPGNFTKLYMKSYMRFTCKYSMKVYELISRELGFNRQEFTINLNRLRKILCVTTKYLSYNNFKQKILKAVQKDFDTLNKQGVLSFSFVTSEIEDDDNEVVSIHFTMHGYTENAKRAKIIEFKKIKAVSV